MVFWLSNPVNGGKDVFWQSRDNALLIKVLYAMNFAFKMMNFALKMMNLH